MPGPVNFASRPWVDGLARRLWPATCLVCGMAGDAGADRDLCAACFAGLPWAVDACPRCALALPGGPASACVDCPGAGSPLHRVEAAFAYAAPLDRLVPMFKFHQSLAAGRLLCALMAHALRGAAEAAPAAVLVPVPLHRARLRQRGYDQALELARPLARRLQMPLEARLLRRPQATAAQSRLGKSARARNLAGAFALQAGARVPAHVVLVDDVMTTGATLEAAARPLLLAGVARVDAWVCARVA